MQRITCYLALVLSSQTAIAEDWPQWQGPNRNAVSSESGLLKAWPEGGPRLAWRIEGLGGGDSAPAVAGGKIYGLSNRDGQEIVWAYPKQMEKNFGPVPLAMHSRKMYRSRKKVQVELQRLTAIVSMSLE